MRSDRHRALRLALVLFVPLAVVVTGMAGTVYVVAQQGLRSGADSPQLQLAEDAARALDAGAAPSTVVGASTVDAASSLAPFIVVFDPAGKPIASSGTLDGTAPVPPRGVLDSAASGVPNRVTWQPRDGLRFATVTVGWSGGTVTAARSLREVERLEDRALLLVAVGWAGTLVALAVVCLAVGWAAGRSSADARPALER